MNSNIEVLRKDATPWYLQIVFRYEHSGLTYDRTEGSVEFSGGLHNEAPQLPIGYDVAPDQGDRLGRELNPRPPVSCPRRRPLLR